MLCTSISINNHHIRKCLKLNPRLNIKFYSKRMIEQATKYLELILYVITHKTGAEVTIHLIERYFFYILLIIFKYLSVYIFKDGCYFSHFTYFKSTRILSTSQVRLSVIYILLNIEYFFEFFHLPKIVVMNTTLDGHLL